MWLDEPFTRGQAWVDLLMLANHQDGHVRVRGNRVSVRRGQVAWSVARLAARWQWSRGKVQRYLDELEDYIMIEQQKNNVTTLISITNYSDYQKTDSRRTAESLLKTPKFNESDQTVEQQNFFVSIDESDTSELLKDKNGQQTDSRRTADGQQTDTNKKDKKDKKDKKTQSDCSRAREALATEIYNLYPRKVGKRAALKVIANLLRDGVPENTLREATQAYAAAVAEWPQEDRKYIPHPATWYRQGRYEDDRSQWRCTDGRRHTRKTTDDDYASIDTEGW